ncbi:FHA domain-containing protein [Litorivivens sp.]|uniref:FHA domain-containing protein n=1 Tax=Litorivivens sp. TaxID=2020868 RepID=UPI003561EE8F
MNSGEVGQSVWALRPCDADAGDIVLANEFTVGREDGCALVLSEPHVSRRHAAFLIKDDKLYLQDTGSANGTFVNDHRINVVVLKAGDIVRFDAARYEVVQAEAAPESQTETAGQKPAEPEVAAGTPAEAAPSSKAGSAKFDPVKAAEASEGVVTFERNARVSKPEPASPSPSASLPLASLLVSGGAVVGLRFALGEGLSRIGRDPGCEIRLDARAVSSLHAELECVDGRWYLRDCDSSNGVLHNGRKVTEVELVDGDQLTLGDVELIFSFKS